MEVKRLHDLNGGKIVIPIHKIRVVEKCSINNQIVNDFNYCGISFRNFKNFSMQLPWKPGTRSIHFIKKYYCSTNNGYVITFGEQIFNMIKEIYNSDISISFVEINIISKIIQELVYDLPSNIGPIPNYDECLISKSDISYDIDEDLEKYLDNINSNYWHKNQKFLNELSKIGFDCSKIISKNREESIDNLLK